MEEGQKIFLTPNSRLTSSTCLSEVRFASQATSGCASEVAERSEARW